MRALTVLQAIHKRATHIDCHGRGIIGELPEIIGGLQGGPCKLPIEVMDEFLMIIIDDNTQGVMGVGMRGGWGCAGGGDAPEEQASIRGTS